LLWFFETANGIACTKFATIAPLRDRLFAYTAQSLGMSVDEVAHAYATREPLGTDSLDLVELSLELEEELGFAIELRDTTTIKTFRDLVDYILRLRI
jgi:acyl carrier protein